MDSSFIDDYSISMQMKESIVPEYMGKVVYFSSTQLFVDLHVFVSLSDHLSFIWTGPENQIANNILFIVCYVINVNLKIVIFPMSSGIFCLFLSSVLSVICASTTSINLYTYVL